ncbi:MAG TPA: ABC transporter ATP-binding protein [Candidatus Aminicenantes bacterium]|nr:ABC transporter ATP-binding protein [Candidatus Aminicenantes bacterium]
MTAVISASHLSKYYGNVLGLNDVSIEIEAGITGLLGPNGAGKSTFMKLATGQMKPDIGTVAIRGRRTWNAPEIFRSVGFCSEPDAFYEDMTGLEFVAGLLRFYGFSRKEIGDRAARALDIVGLTGDRDRLVRGYSRGMRQRVKFAQAIAHDPEILILDEPLSGLDSLGKRKLIKLIKGYREEGRTVLVSSHVLPEIEALTSRVVLVHQGRILAEGDVPYIRELIEAHPHQVSVRSSDPRRLAARFVDDPAVLKMTFGGDGRTLVVETRKRDDLFERLAPAVLEAGIEVEEISSPDDNLEAVFKYLVGA